MIYRSRQKARSKSPKKWLLLVVILALLGGGIYWWHKDQTSQKKLATSGTLSPATSGVSASNNASSAKTPTTDTAHLVSGGQDTHGQASSSTNSSQWITSTSGNITLQQPLTNSTLVSGATVSGTAKVDQVSFRLIDNSVGEISEDTLSVVNGKFSGTISFTTHSSAGQLDVYSINSKGVEINEIQIAVKL